MLAFFGTNLGLYVTFGLFFGTIWVFWAFKAVLLHIRFVVIYALFWVNLFLLKPCSCKKIVFLHLSCVYQSCTVKDKLLEDVNNIIVKGTSKTIVSRGILPGSPFQLFRGGFLNNTNTKYFCKELAETLVLPGLSYSTCKSYFAK